MTVQIDKGVISLPAAAAIIVATFSAGGAAAYFESRLQAVERGTVKTERLLGAICRKLSCDAEGMRE